MSESVGVPVAVAESVLSLFGVNMKCYVLDNGQRIFDAADFAAAMDAMLGGVVADEKDISAFVAWRMGK